MLSYNRLIIVYSKLEDFLLPLQFRKYNIKLLILSSLTSCSCKRQFLQEERINRERVLHLQSTMEDSIILFFYLSRSYFLAIHSQAKKKPARKTMNREWIFQESSSLVQGLPDKRTLDWRFLTGIMNPFQEEVRIHEQSVTGYMTPLTAHWMVKAVRRV